LLFSLQYFQIIGKINFDIFEQAAFPPSSVLLSDIVLILSVPYLPRPLLDICGIQHHDLRSLAKNGFNHQTPKMIKGMPTIQPPTTSSQEVTVGSSTSEAIFNAPENGIPLLEKVRGNRFMRGLYATPAL
jgi:hypothetical protein